MMRNPNDEVAAAIVRVTPPAALTLYDQVAVMPVEKWLTITLIIYTVLQTILLIRDRVVRRRRKADAKEMENETK